MLTADAAAAACFEWLAKGLLAARCCGTWTSHRPTGWQAGASGDRAESTKLKLQTLSSKSPSAKASCDGFGCLFRLH